MVLLSWWKRKYKELKFTSNSNTLTINQVCLLFDYFIKILHQYGYTEAEFILYSTFSISQFYYKYIFLTFL